MSLLKDILKHHVDTYLLIQSNDISVSEEKIPVDILPFYFLYSRVCRSIILTLLAFCATAYNVLCKK